MPRQFCYGKIDSKLIKKKRKNAPANFTAPIPKSNLHDAGINRVTFYNFILISSSFSLRRDLKGQKRNSQFAVNISVGFETSVRTSHNTRAQREIGCGMCERIFATRISGMHEEEIAVRAAEI